MQIKELHLFTDDLISTITFYKNVLQLPVKEEEHAGITFQVGETKLIFKASVNQHPTYHFAFAIPANQIQEAYEWAKDKKMIVQYGLEYFYRQPPLEDFAAVGDDNGLFIVVPENRNWYPTNLHSSKSRMKVVFTSGIESEQKVMELAGEK